MQGWKQTTVDSGSQQHWRQQQLRMTVAAAAAAAAALDCGGGHNSSGGGSRVEFGRLKIKEEWWVKNKEESKIMKVPRAYAALD
jgi:hypothetical protein